MRSDRPGLVAIGFFAAAFGVLALPIVMLPLFGPSSATWGRWISFALFQSAWTFLFFPRRTAAVFVAVCLAGMISRDLYRVGVSEDWRADLVGVAVAWTLAILLRHQLRAPQTTKGA